MIESRAWTKWMLLVAGPVIWAAHFAFIYSASGLDHVRDRSAGPSRVAVLLSALAALALLAFLLRKARRLGDEAWGKADLAAFWRRTSSLLLLLAMLAIVWQALPALLVS